MAFDVQNYKEFIRFLTEHPEWRSELRQLLLMDELVELREAIHSLTKAQQRTEERVERLVEAQARTEERVGRLEEAMERLAEAQARTEERVGRLEEAVERLVEAQRRTEERVGRLEEAVERLAEAQARTEERVEALAEAQRRTEERVGRLEEAVERLAEAQRRTEERVEALVEAQRRTEERVGRLEEAVERLAEAQARTEGQLAALAETVKGLTDTVSGLKGRVLEFSFGNKAGAYFGPLLQKLRIVAPYTLADALQARLSREEFKDVLLLDLLVCGQLREHPEAPEIWLAIEVSAVVDRVDVERARRRATLLNRAGYRAIPVVAGERATQGAEHEARAHKVIMVEDGHLAFWDEALQTWGPKRESTPN